MLHGRVGQASDTIDSSLVIINVVDCSNIIPFARIKMKLRLFAVLSLDMPIQPCGQNSCNLVQLEDGIHWLQNNSMDIEIISHLILIPFLFTSPLLTLGTLEIP
jgi:hypothetical protein